MCVIYLSSTSTTQFIVPYIYFLHKQKAKIAKYEPEMKCEAARLNMACD